LYGYGKKIVWNAGVTNDLIDEYKGSNKLCSRAVSQLLVHIQLRMNTTAILQSESYWVIL